MGTTGRGAVFRVEFDQTAVRGDLLARLVEVAAVGGLLADPYEVVEVEGDPAQE